MSTFFSQKLPKKVPIKRPKDKKLVYFKNLSMFLTLFYFYRYRADDITGYVAEVRYEGSIKPFVPPPPPPVEPVLAALKSKGLPPGGRPVVKRNENTSVDDFEFATDIKDVKEVTNKRQHNKQKQQQQKQQQRHKQQKQEYYQPQAYRPF